MINILIKYFLLFIIYSFIGWTMEMLITAIENKKIIDRGFLIGPYCPIYGVGGTLMTVFLTRFQNNILLLFFMAIIVCGLLEYFTSYIMEKLFKARWWDYSNKKINLHGRICADTLIPFGVLGTFIICIANPFFIDMINNIPKIFLIIITIFLFVVFIADTIVSIVIIFNLRGTIKKIALDNTEEITEKVKEAIKERSIIYNRLVKAFPNWKVKISKK